MAASWHRTVSCRAGLVSCLRLCQPNPHPPFSFSFSVLQMLKTAHQALHRQGTAGWLGHDKEIAELLPHANRNQAGTGARGS